MTEAKNFPERLRWARSEAGLTQKELAERSGISVPQIVRYEAGRSTPRLAVLMKLADALGVSLEYLSNTDDAEEAGREITLSLTAREEATLHEYAKRQGLTFDAAVQQIIAFGLKERVEANPDLLAQLEQDVPGAYEKLVELLKKS